MYKYSEESPIPNWPKEIKKEHFSIYCTPVLEAIEEGLKKIGENNLYIKFTSEQRNNITYEELEKIQKAYNEQVDYILMMSELNSK